MEPTTDWSAAGHKAIKTIKRKAVKRTDAARKAWATRRGENRMLAVTVRFWTNDIAATKGKIIPKHAWDGGMVSINVGQNAAHGLASGKKPQPFHSVAEIPTAITKLLVDHGIVLHHGEKPRKLYASGNSPWTSNGHSPIHNRV